MTNPIHILMVVARVQNRLKILYMMGALSQNFLFFFFHFSLSLNNKINARIVFQIFPY